MAIQCKVLQYTMPPKKAKYPYPSRFGSHTSMVIGFDDINPNIVVCEDEFGRYETLRSRLDNGLADQNRYDPSRLGKLYERTMDEKQ